MLRAFELRVDFDMSKNSFDSNFAVIKLEDEK